MKVGVLALQGAFREHLEMLKQCGQEGIVVKTKAELKQISGLIIPGGESTAIGKLMNSSQLDEAIIHLYNCTNIPIFGKENQRTRTIYFRTNGYYSPEKRLW